MRYWNRLSLSVVLLSCCTTSALGTSLDSLSIADAVVLALRNNQNVKIAHLQRVVDDFDLKVAQDKFNPDVYLNANAIYEKTTYDRGSSSGEIRDERTMIESNIDIRQLLPLGTEILLRPVRYDLWYNQTGSLNEKRETSQWLASY